jgi:GT2 family glycosyltransferase
MGGAPEEQMPQLFHYIAERYYTQKRAVGGLELVLCPSRFLMDTFLRYGFESARTIHSPQGANLFEPEERTERVVPPVVFSYLGTVDYRKGTDLAVEAFNRIETEEAELHIYGNVADQTYFNKVMQSVSPGKSVTYHGEYSAEDLPGILASTDVALVPSRGENYPFVIREILNARIPVIASAIAGIPEIVKDGVNGFLFRGNDVGDLASKMERLIKEPSLIETLREGIGPVKSIAQDAEEIEGRYLTLLGRGAESPSAEVEEPTRKKVSIIIPVYNQMEFTEKCIELLYENTPEESSFEAIVVDNASSDGTREYLESQQEDGRLRALFNEENLGFARACNQGAGAARGEYLLFLNNDTETLPGWLEPLVEILDNDPAVAAVGSKLLFPDGKIQHAGVVMARLVKEENLLSPFHVFYNEDADHPPANMPHVYQAVTAACVLIRRSSFEEVGGFDEGYWNGFEDVDLCFKFHERGWLVVYEPRSVVVHYEGQSGPDRNSRTAGNLQRLHEKWVGKVEVDVVVEPDGRQKPSGVGRVRMYVAPTERSDEMKDIPIAAVVIVTYNSASTIKACLDTVLASSTGPAEVVVVDNASTDETKAILSDYEGRITAVLNEENRGFSRACNQGIQASSAGDYVVLLNPDTAVTPGWLERMAAHFGPDVGAVGPVSSCVAANQLVSRYMPEGREGQFGIVELAELLFEANRGRSVEAKLLIGFCMMFSRKALDESPGASAKGAGGSWSPPIASSTTRAR